MRREAVRPEALGLRVHGLPAGARLRREEVAMLLDPVEQALHPDWQQTVRHCVAAFRKRLGADAGDPRDAQLVGELSPASEEFRRVWAGRDVERLALLGSLTASALAGPAPVRG